MDVVFAHLEKAHDGVAVVGKCAGKPLGESRSVSPAGSAGWVASVVQRPTNRWSGLKPGSDFIDMLLVADLGSG
jgi:hypothetical protein